MRRLLPLALVLAACSPQESTPPSPANVGTASTPPATSPSTPTAAVPVSATTDNPNRVHQLKDLKTVTMDVKGHRVKAWVMDTDAKTQEGMMFLQDKDVKADEGMLFVFPQVQPKVDQDGIERGFWMHNTLIPLDIVFMSPKGQVLSVGHGKPQDDTTIPAGGDFQYVLELKAGTAARYGLKPGDTLTIPKLPPP